MKLYHFTAKRFLDNILFYGITKGATPLFKEEEFIGFIENTQWLTINRSFEQKWCEKSSLPYSRTEVKLTIKIPKAYQDNLENWDEFSKRIGKENFCKDFDLYDSENWRIYTGEIKPEWIINYKFKSGG